MATELEEAFGGGGYSALQRAALLQLAWDHVASGLDGREAAFELHANGGVPAWRRRLRTWFSSYNELANGVHEVLGVDIPQMDLHSLRQIAVYPAASGHSTTSTGASASQPAASDCRASDNR